MSSVSEERPSDVASVEAAPAPGSPEVRPENPEHSAHDDHGNTPAAWTAVTIMMVASVVGALGIIVGSWPLFWIGGIGLLVVGAVVGKVMSMMGYGAAGHHHEDHAPTD